VWEASFTLLRDLFALESKEILKMSALTHKSLYPNNIERQSVQLPLKVFNEKTIVALLEKRDRLLPKYSLQDCFQTACFLEYIMRYWQIISVRSTLKGIHLRQDIMHPIRSPESNSLKILEQFSTWLVCWKELETSPTPDVSVAEAEEDVEGEENFDPNEPNPNEKQKPKKKKAKKPNYGKLTVDTQKAYERTTQALIEIAKYSVTKIPEVQYILLGELNNDCIEGRHGRYRERQTHNASVADVLMAERGLKMLQITKLRANGLDISIKELQRRLEEVCPEVVLDPDEVTEQFDGVLTSLTLVAVPSDNQKVLLYISGYIAKKLIKKQNCSECESLLVTGEPLLVDVDSCTSYTQFLNRGGLRIPKDFLFEAVILTYQLNQTLMSSDHRDAYLGARCQRAIFTILAEKTLSEELVIEDKCSRCGAKMCDLIKEMVPVTCCNVYCNNFRKMENDRIHSLSKAKGKSRKLATLV
jgi:hypothetical protein